MKPIIKVENLSKQYHIGAQQAPYATLRESIVGALRAPFNRLNRNEPSEDNSFWALKDVSFEVLPGEVVGVIGRNGAGKSTLLKILSRITEPSAGGVDLYGRVGSLLEVGTGFHPELTGRENIYLNGAILGMRKQEIKSKFDEIVAFAEVDKFLDTPVKHYSSGMYVRLAFAVAAHMEPEILLVDEVLAVGDSGFQHKCIERMQSLARSGCSMLFVSHNMSAVQSLCQRVVLLQNGQISKIGRPADIVQGYFKDVHAHLLDNVRRPVSTSDLQITSVIVSRDGETPCSEFRMGDSLFVTIEYEARKPIAQPHFSIGITDGGWKPMVLASMLVDGQTPHSISGSGRITCRFLDLPLLPKVFQIWGSVRGNSGFGDIIDWQHLANFRITETDSRVVMGDDSSLQHLQDDAPFYLSYDWQYGNPASGLTTKSTDRFS
jgi:lipopolysaccharide transport system ATP-binding protein